MSPTHNNPEPPDSAAQLAHELANLLDGSLRHLHLAIDTLNRPGETPAGGDNLLGRLQTTDRAMRQMASLIQTWMRSAPRPGELFDQGQTLGQTLEQAVEVHRPAAERQGIDLTLELDPRAANLPAGPVFPVIANAIVNGLEALADTPPADDAPRQIRVTARLELGRVYLIVADTGPGLEPEMLDDQQQPRFGHSTKPDGHGLGLTLSHQIARSLDGTLTLRNNPDRGATLTLRYPATMAPRAHDADTPHTAHTD